MLLVSHLAENKLLFLNSFQSQSLMKGKVQEMVGVGGEVRKGGTSFVEIGCINFLNDTGQMPTVKLLFVYLKTTSMF